MVLQLVIWGLVGVLLGICFVIVLPWTAAQIAGREWIETVSDYYIWLAQTAARRSALIIRDGDVKLVPKRYDSDLKADKDSSTGDKRHHRDDFDAVSRLKNKILGIGLTKRDTYVSPLLAELGEAAMTQKERQNIGSSETKGDVADKMQDGIEIPEQSQLVDLSAARHLTTGSSEPESGQESYEKTKISQEKFHERVSFGQGMMLILGTVASMGVAWFAASRGGGASPGAAGGNTTTISLLFALAGLSMPSINWDKAIAVVYSILFVVTVPLIALAVGGPLTFVLVIAMMLLSSLGLVGFIVLMGPSLPVFLGMAFARGFWILAQLTVGRGVLVERDSGELEHRMLMTAADEFDADYFTVLSDGKELPIDGSKGDLFRFAWGDLGATAEKSEENMGSITEEIPTYRADGGTIMPENLRQGYQPEIRVPEDDEWLVTLPQLWTLCQNTSESAAVRQGRNKALTEHGGEQQISMVVFFAILGVMIVVGGLMGLVAGGAIP